MIFSVTLFFETEIEIIIKIQLECNAISGYSFIEKIRSQLEIIQSAGDHVLDTHP